MNITSYASAAIIALAMSAGTVSAEEQISLMKDTASAPAEAQISIMKAIPSAIPMTDEQLGETVGANEEHGYRRRWFHRRMKFIPCQECEI